MKAEVAALMAADATIAAALTGGIYATVTALSKAQTAAAFDSFGRVKPCALVKLEMEAATGPRGAFKRQIAQLYFYESMGSAGIQSAADRTRVVLQESKLANGWEVKFMDTLPDLWDDVLEANMIISRYTAVRT